MASSLGSFILGLGPVTLTDSVKDEETDTEPFFFFPFMVRSYLLNVGKKEKNEREAGVVRSVNIG
jgi:hypothetical protein